MDGHGDYESKSAFHKFILWCSVAFILLFVCFSLLTLLKVFGVCSPSSGVRMDKASKLHINGHNSTESDNITVYNSYAHENAGVDLSRNIPEVGYKYGYMYWDTYEGSDDIMHSSSMSLHDYRWNSRPSPKSSFLDSGIVYHKSDSKVVHSDRDNYGQRSALLSAATILASYSFINNGNWGGCLFKTVIVVALAQLAKCETIRLSEGIANAINYPDHHDTSYPNFHMIPNQNCGDSEVLHFSPSWLCGNQSDVLEKKCNDVDFIPGNNNNCNGLREEIENYINCMEGLKDVEAFQHSCSSLSHSLRTSGGDECKRYLEIMNVIEIDDGGTRAVSSRSREFIGFNRMFRFDQIWSSTAYLERGYFTDSPSSAYAESTPYGFNGQLPTCQILSFWPKLAEMNKADLDGKKTMKFFITYESGVVFIKDSEGIIVDSKTNDLSINKKSCKSKWKPSITKFTVSKPSKEWMIIVDIEPWKGYVYSQTNRDNNLEVYVSVIYYLSLLSKKNSGIKGGLYDINKLPKDDCGCSSRDMCYKTHNHVIMIGHDNSISHRKLEESASIRVTHCNSMSNSEANVSIYTYGCLSEMGLYMARKATPDSRKMVFLDKIIIDDSYQYTSDDDGNLIVKKSDGSKQLVAGIYLKDLAMRDENGGTDIEIENAHEIKTRHGKYIIDECLTKFNDGSLISGLNLHRCRLGMTSVQIILFYSTIAFCSTIIFLHIIHLIIMIRSYRNKKHYYSKAILKVYCLYSVAGSDYKEALDDMMKGNTDNNLIKQLNNYEVYIIGNKFTKLIGRIVAWVPSLSILVFIILLPFWIIKLLMTIFMLPMKIIYGRMFAESITFTNFYEFIMGPNCMMPISGGLKSNLKKKKILRCSSGVIKSATISSFYVVVIVFLVLSLLIQTGEADKSSGASVFLKGACEQGTCNGVLNILGSLLFTNKFKQTHPIYHSQTSALIGQLEIEMVNGSYHHELTYQFSSPSFTSEVSRIICQSNDMHFRHKCWGRFHEPEDEDELGCSNWGQQGESFIPSDKDKASRGIYKCDTYGGKGFWWGLSSPADGLEWIGVKIEPDFNKRGRRQWTTGIQSLNGHVKISLHVNDDLVLEELIELDRLLNSYHFDGSLGTVILSERRVWGEDLSGMAINCEYESLIYSGAPDCHIISKPWADPQNLNIFGEANTTSEGILDYNGIEYLRLSSLGDSGSDIRFRNINEPKRNYYGSSGKVKSHSSCSSQIERLSDSTKRTENKCTDRSKQTEKSCGSIREAWGMVSSTIPQSKLILTDCEGIMIDYNFLLNINFRSDSSKIESVDVGELSIEVEGCFGANGELKITIVSSSSQTGLVKLEVPEDYVSCPSSVMISSGENSIECSSNIKHFTLEVHDPMPNGNSKTFNVNVGKACSGFVYHEICDDCTKNMPLNHNETLLWWEILIIVAACVIGIIIISIVIVYVIPAIAQTRSIQRSGLVFSSGNLPVNYDSESVRRRLVTNMKSGLN